jgi:plastocyanin
MFKHTLLFATLCAAIAAVPSTAVAQPAKKERAAGLSPKCAANAPVREFLVVAGEWDTVPKDKDGKPAAYNDRGQPRAANSKLERYTFDPSVIIVKKGDCVTLRIHDLKGDHHNVTIEGTEVGTEGAALIDDAGKVIGKAVARANPNAFEGPDKLKAGEFARGEEVMFKFQANQPGTYRMICEVHTFVGPKGELRGYDDKGKPVQGPMVAYITVLP